MSRNIDLTEILQGSKSHLQMAMLIPIYLTVLILPINAFGSGQMHSKNGSPDENTALVQHLFKGSWKADHPFRDEAVKPQEDEAKLSEKWNSNEIYPKWEKEEEKEQRKQRKQ